VQAATLAKQQEAIAAGQSNRGNDSRTRHANLGTRDSELSKSRRLRSKTSHADLLCSRTCEQERSAKAAVPSHHRAAHRAKPRMPDQTATSSPAPSRVPRARPRKHAIAGHQYVTAASRRPPRACRCPGSLSIASLPVGSCPTAPPSRRVDSPSRIPPAELPEPPLTGKHELCVLDTGRGTAFPRL
jgi:hypothetical protein